MAVHHWWGGEKKKNLQLLLLNSSLHWRDHCVITWCVMAALLSSVCLIPPAHVETCASWLCNPACVGELELWFIPSVLNQTRDTVTHPPGKWCLSLPLRLTHFHFSLLGLGEACSQAPVIVVEATWDGARAGGVEWSLPGTQLALPKHAGFSSERFHRRRNMSSAAKGTGMSLNLGKAHHCSMTATSPVSPATLCKNKRLRARCQKDYLHSQWNTSDVWQFQGAFLNKNRRKWESWVT